MFSDEVIQKLIGDLVMDAHKNVDAKIFKGSAYILETRGGVLYLFFPVAFPS